jgi:cytochrome c oxidase subunit 4
MSENVRVPYSKYLMVWFALVLGTGITIMVAGLQVGGWSVFAAIAIAAIKATLVLFYFMHLRYESVMFKAALTVAMLTLAVIMALTFADVSFR